MDFLGGGGERFEKLMENGWGLVRGSSSELEEQTVGAT